MLERAGVTLVADQYEAYLNKLKAVNQAQKEAFSGEPQKKFQQEVDKTKTKAAEAKSAFERMKEAIGKVFSGDVTGGMMEFQQALGGMRAGILAVVVALGGMKLIQFAEQSVQVALRNETMGVVLQNVGKQAGYTKQQVDYATESVMKMGITTSAARKTLTDMAQAGIEWTNSSKLARVAQDAAVIGNIDSSQAFERMIYGIKSGQIEVLRTIGINVQFEASYKKMAQQLGKNATALTEQEKVQARANSVIEEGAKIAGTYEAAMGTAGKMQSSMVRLIEETQNNIGAMLLPLKTAAVEMEYNFWKGAEKATSGLKEWGVAIDAIIIGLKSLGSSTKEAEGTLTFPEKIGKALHDAARTFTQFHIGAVATLSAIGAGFDALVAKIEAMAGSLADSVSLAMDLMKAQATGNYGEVVKKLQEMQDPAKTAARQKARAEAAGKDIGQAMGDAWNESLVKQISAIEEKYPDWNKPYGEGIDKVDLAPKISAAEAYAQKLEEANKALGMQLAILKQVEAVDKNYRKAQENAQKGYTKSLAQADKDLAKAKENLNKKTADNLNKIDKDAAKSADQLQREAAKSQVEAQKQLNRDLEQEAKRFQLSQLQDLRRFKNQEKWLMAEGDVLGLMKAREDFALQQKEAKENFNLQKDEQVDNAKEQTRQEQEQLQNRLEELQASVQERRQEVIDSYQTELEDLIKANEEKKTAAAETLAEQLQAAKDARDQQLAELGDNLKAQKDLTQAGMQQIADTIAKTFGEEGAADALMKGWSERSQTAIGQAMEDMQRQIEATNELIEKTRAGLLPVPETAASKNLTVPGTPGVHRARGMRQGGVGVVTGPALFEVEPGIKEAFAFMPLNRGGTNSSLNVNVGGGIDVRGAQNASPGVVDAAIEVMFGEISTAIRRLRKA